MPFSYASGIPDVGRRADNYGIPGFELDGNDVLEVHRVAGQAVERARRGKGPSLIECKTYRTRPHVEGSADFTYRTRQEVDDWKTRCPIQQLHKRMVEENLATNAELENIQQEIRELIEQSHEFAEASAYPSSESATVHVYDEDATPRQAWSEPHPGNRETTFVHATVEALDQAMAENPGIFVMGEGIGSRGREFQYDSCCCMTSTVQTDCVTRRFASEDSSGSAAGQR